MFESCRQFVVENRQLWVIALGPEVNIHVLLHYYSSQNVERDPRFSRRPRRLDRSGPRSCYESSSYRDVDLDVIGIDVVCLIGLDVSEAKTRQQIGGRVELR